MSIQYRFLRKSVVVLPDLNSEKKLAMKKATAVNGSRSDSPMTVFKE